MTGLEKEIRQYIDDHSAGLFDDEKELIIRAAKDVAKKYIEKAFSAGAIQYGFKSLEGKFVSIEEMKTEWLKENGIV